MNPGMAEAMWQHLISKHHGNVGTMMKSGDQAVIRIV
jgi:hypothetical protein